MNKSFFVVKWWLPFAIGVKAASHWMDDGGTPLPWFWCRWLPHAPRRAHPGFQVKFGVVMFTVKWVWI